MPYIDTPVVRLYYEEFGSGRPLVFVHGWAMSGRVWEFQKVLADRHRMILFDQRGHGLSGRTDSYRVGDYAADLAALVTQLDLHDAVIVGWSMGTQIALTAFPELRSRLAALVLIGGTPRFTTAAGYPHGAPEVEVKGMAVRLRRDYQKTLGDFFRGMFVEGEMDSAQYQRIVHEIVLGGHSPDVDAVKESLHLLSSIDLRDELSSVDRPVLLVHGSGDTICPASASEFMAQRLPLAHVKIMEGCGHAPFMTRPEQFNAILCDYLNGLGGGK